MKRINVYLKGQIEQEIDYFASQYKVSPAYVLQLAFKLSDRKKIEQLLEIKLKDLD